MTMHAMEMRSTISTAPANRGQPTSSEAEIEIDLDRIVYDPAYRRLVRDQLNRTTSRAEPKRG